MSIDYYLQSESYHDPGPCLCYDTYGISTADSAPCMYIGHCRTFQFKEGQCNSYALSASMLVSKCSIGSVTLFCL